MLRVALSISPKKPGMLLLDGKYAKKNKKCSEHPYPVSSHNQYK
jgi:hypothetical protein